METFTMSRKELPRAGLVTAAVAGRISNREGAAALQLTPRQFQRLKQRMRQAGAEGLRHRGRGRPSHRRLPAGVCARVQALLQDRYAGFNDTHLTEKLRELHGLTISRESVRRLRRALGLGAVHRRRPAQHRARRPREAAAGQVLQLGGSPFDWLEARGPRLTLLGAIDDATSEVVALHFRPTEDLHGYVTLLRHVFTTAGLPVALYGDGINILVRNDQHWDLAEQLAGAQAPTHVGRMLQELGIGYVRARSPQAKGRIERLFSRAAQQADPVWRRPPRDLELVLSCRYSRVVARDNTVRVGPRVVQIPRGPGGRSYARRRVDMRELLDGRVVILVDGTIIARAAAPAGAFTLAPRRGPHAARPAARRPERFVSARPLRRALTALATALPPAPPRRHPWRRGYDPQRALRAGYPRYRG